MHRVDTPAKGSGPDALLQNARDHADQGRMHVLDPGRGAHVSGATPVFIIEQHDEIRVQVEVIERAFDQLLDRLVRRQSCKVQLAFLSANFLVHPFQDREVERILVAEVVIEQLLVDACARGDFIDPRTGKAAFREFAPSGAQKFFPSVDRVPPLRFCAVRSPFKHFQPDS